MLLETITKKNRFVLDGLTFVVDGNVINVFDDGMLQVGKFSVTDVDNDSNLEYHPDEDYPNTIDRLNASGNSSVISKQLNSII